MLAVAHFKQKSLCPVAFPASVILRDYFYCSSAARLDAAKMLRTKKRKPCSLQAKTTGYKNGMKGSGRALPLKDIKQKLMWRPLSCLMARGVWSWSKPQQQLRRSSNKITKENVWFMTRSSPVVCVPDDKWNVRVLAAVYLVNRYYGEHAADFPLLLCSLTSCFLSEHRFWCRLCRVRFFSPSPYMRAQMCSITLITSWPVTFKSHQKLWLKEGKNSDKLENKQHKNNSLLLRVLKIIKTCNYICAKQRKVAQLTPTGHISISSERVESDWEGGRAFGWESPLQVQSHAWAVTSGWKTTHVAGEGRKLN